MKRKYIIYEKDGNIARVILNKPEKLNALGFVGTLEDIAEVYSALDEAANDDDVKVVILKGNGRAFCAGDDLNTVGFVYGMGTGKPGERRPSQRIRLKTDRATMCNGFRDHIFLHPKLTIAQVHGYCLEGGAIMMSLCDIAIAAEDALLGFPGQRLGLAGSSLMLNILIETIGLKRALYLLLSGEKISGKEAERLGWVTKAVPADRLEDEVETVAKMLCLLPRDGIAIGKAERHAVYDTRGLTHGFTLHYIMHTLFTNWRSEPDEFNFFKQRRDKGTKVAFHDRDTRFAKLGH